MPAAEQRQVAKMAFKYDGKQLDRGQIFTLAGARNDERLRSLRIYFRELGRREETFRCAGCGAEFIAPGEREGHGRLRHPEQPRTPQQEEALWDREDRRTEQSVGPELQELAARQR